MMPPPMGVLPPMMIPPGMPPPPPGMMGTAGGPPPPGMQAMMMRPPPGLMSVPPPGMPNSGTQQPGVEEMDEVFFTTCLNFPSVYLICLECTDTSGRLFHDVTVRNP